MKIENLGKDGEVLSILHCEGCGQPFGDLWKHSMVCSKFMRLNKIG